MAFPMLRFTNADRYHAISLRSASTSIGLAEGQDDGTLVEVRYIGVADAAPSTTDD